MDTDKCFRDVCAILFHADLGEYCDYQKFLGRYSSSLKQTKSTISGKPVFYFEPYCRNAKIISFDEHDLVKSEPLQLDELKDIDSLLAAVQERFHYSGNKVFGNYQDVTNSESCSDSFQVFNSQNIFNCDSVLDSQMITDSKYMAGCAWGTFGNFCMNSTEIYKVNRTFEATIVVYSSDVYFGYNCKNCAEIMFCLNQYSKRHCIGNTPLPRDEYFDLKNKLLAEITDELKRKKTFPSLIELLSIGGQQ